MRRLLAITLIIALVILLSLWKMIRSDNGFSLLSSAQIICGNYIVEEGEECDEGRFNGEVGSCNSTCKKLTCGDGILSLQLHEECEPKRGGASGGFDVPACGSGLVCAAPVCEEGTCTGGCIYKRLKACSVAISSAPSVAAYSQNAAVPASSSLSIQNSVMSASSSLPAQNSATSSSVAVISSSASAASTSVLSYARESRRSLSYSSAVSSSVFPASSSFSSSASISSSSSSASVQTAIATLSSTSSSAVSSSSSLSTADLSDLLMTAFNPPVAEPETVEGDPALDATFEVPQGEVYASQDDGSYLDAVTAAVSLKKSDQKKAALEAAKAFPPDCGNSLLDRGEDCDDGSHANGDGCSERCRFERGFGAECGNDVIEKGEECDTGNENSDETPSACRTNCRLAKCGDSILDLREECDDGAANSNAIPNACRTNCRLATCGDGTKDEGEQCDTAGKKLKKEICQPSCRFIPRCGDGRKDPGEQCDHGAKNSNITPGSCRTTCKKPRCGDGLRDPGEECDQNLPEKCTPKCRVPRCGDGLLSPKEQCDDGNRNNRDDCTNTCKPSRCGDGFLSQNEQCDDGNTNGGDGCKVCKLEHGYACKGTFCFTRCGDNIVAGVESCDDGNMQDGDGCNSSCHIRLKESTVRLGGTILGVIFGLGFLGRLIAAAAGSARRKPSLRR